MESRDAHIAGRQQMVRISNALCAALLLLSHGIALHAQGNGHWEFLGDANISGSANHVRIISSGSRVPFAALRIRVQNAAIKLDHIVVYYGETRAVTISVLASIPAGGSTPAIELPREHEPVRSIELWYRQGNWDKQHPKVRLFGMR